MDDFVKMIDFALDNNDCNGCGYCCLRAPCPFFYLYYGATVEDRICPYLQWNGDRYVCNLYLKNQEKFGKELYIGEGCSSGMNDWRWDVRERTESEVRMIRNG